MKRLGIRKNGEAQGIAERRNGEMIIHFTFGGSFVFAYEY